MSACLTGALLVSLTTKTVSKSDARAISRRRSDFDRKRPHSFNRLFATPSQNFYVRPSIISSETICFRLGISSKLIKIRRDALNAGSQNSEGRDVRDIREPLTGGSPTFELAFPPIVVSKANGVYVRMQQEGWIRGLGATTRGKRTRVQSRRWSRNARFLGSAGGPYYNGGKSNESIVKVIIIAVHEILHSDDSTKVSFRNVPSCPTITSEDPAQQWLAGSDAIYPSGIRKILCEPQSTHSRPSSRQ